MRRGCGSAAVQLRAAEVHRLPYVAVRCASRRHPGAHRAAVDRCRRVRAGSPIGDEPDAGTLAGHCDRGRRSDHRTRGRRTAEEHRGAGAAYGLDLVRTDRDDVVATVRSRCRLLTLQTPTIPAVARLLEARDGVEPELAAYAARVSQGHIGRARCWRGARCSGPSATDFADPFQLHGLGACLAAAAQVVEASTVEAAAATGSWMPPSGRHSKRPWDSARRGRSRARHRPR